MQRLIRLISTSNSARSQIETAFWPINLRVSAFIKAPPPVASTAGPAVKKPGDHAGLAGAEIRLAPNLKNLRNRHARGSLDFRVSIDERQREPLASLRPTEDFPAPIMPTSTSERPPSASTIADSAERAGEMGESLRHAGSCTGCPAPIARAGDYKGGGLVLAGCRAILVRPVRTCWYSHRRIPFAPAGNSCPMPSLFRFLAAVAIVVAIVYGSMVALTVLVQPQSREISVTIPQDRFCEQR